MIDKNIRRVPVTIHHREYLIRTDESVQYINKLAGILDRKMQHISAGNPNISEIKLAVLSALTILDSYSKLRDEHEALRVSLGKQEQAAEEPSGPLQFDPDQTTLDHSDTE